MELDVAVLALLLLYIVYWIIKAMVDKLYSEALIAMGVGVLSAQIFIVAYYSGQFLRLIMHKNINIALQTFGVALLLLSLALLAGAFFSKRKMSKLTSFWGSTQLFMTQGIYGVIRHPVQLGGITATLGIALMMASPIVIILAFIATATFLLAAHEEDRHGQEIVGHEYSAYMDTVPSYNLVKGLIVSRKASRS